LIFDIQFHIEFDEQDLFELKVKLNVKFDHNLMFTISYIIST